MSTENLLTNLIKNPEYSEILTRKIFEMDTSITERAKLMIEKIEEDNFINTKEKGTIFEELIMIFFRDINPNIFRVHHSVKSSSNELDSLVDLKENGCILNIDKILGFSGKNFIVECKNYNQNIDVTWVGKFAHLMNSHNVRYGILFSKYPLTGLEKGKMTWENASGLVKKFYLKYDAKIINLTLADIKSVVYGEVTFFEVINKKNIDLQFDTDIELIQHENSSRTLIEV